MADSRITPGNPYINPDWQQHPVDWAARAAEEAAERAELEASETLLDIIFFSHKGRPVDMVRSLGWYRRGLT